jgi:hypothetical protein
VNTHGIWQSLLKKPFRETSLDIGGRVLYDRVVHAKEFL